VRRRTPFNFDGASGVTTTTPVKMEDVVKGDIASAGAQSLSPTPIPRASAPSRKCNRSKKGKAKRKVFSFSDDDGDEDGDFRPNDTSSTSGLLKRRKTENDEGSSSIDRPVRVSRPSILPAPGEGANNHLTRQLLTPPGPDCQQRDHNVVHMMEERGVSYTEHPLKRTLVTTIRFPVMQIPNNVARNFEHGPTAEEIQRKIQGKVRFKLWGEEGAAEEGPSETLSGGVSKDCDECSQYKC